MCMCVCIQRPVHIHANIAQHVHYVLLPVNCLSFRARSLAVNKVNNIPKEFERTTNIRTSTLTEYIIIKIIVEVTLHTRAIVIAAIILSSVCDSLTTTIFNRTLTRSFLQDFKTFLYALKINLKFPLTLHA